MITDLNKGIAIEYNYLNLPMEISSSTANVEYVYDAAENKLRVTLGTVPRYYAGINVIDKYGNSHYRKATNQSPQSLLRLYGW